MKTNVIYNEECLRGMSERIPDDSIDLVITDPPYKLVGGGQKDTKMAGTVNQKENENAKNGKMFQYNNLSFNEWFKFIFDVLKNRTHFYCMTNDKHLREMLNAAHANQLKELNMLVWDKKMHSPTHYYMKNIEFIGLFRKGGARKINDLGSFALIKIEGIRGKENHPTEKPIKLMEHLIKNSSERGDIVLDPFIGSGTTAIAAKKLGRKYIGFEQDEEYYEIAQDRVNEV